MEVMMTKNKRGKLKPLMKKLKLIAIVAVTISSLISCGGGINKQPANAEGFGAIEK